MALTPKDIAGMLDHSMLQPWLTDADIRQGCEIALKYETASVCARPCDVPILAEMLEGSEVKVCFIHVPYLPQQGEPNLPLEDTAKALEAAIACLD